MFLIIRLIHSYDRDTYEATNWDSALTFCLEHLKLT